MKKLKIVFVSLFISFGLLSLEGFFYNEAHAFSCCKSLKRAIKKVVKSVAKTIEYGITTTVETAANLAVGATCGTQKILLGDSICTDFNTLNPAVQVMLCQNNYADNYSVMSLVCNGLPQEDIIPIACDLLGGQAIPIDISGICEDYLADQNITAPSCTSKLSTSGWTNNDVQVQVDECEDWFGEPCDPKEYSESTISTHNTRGFATAGDSLVNADIICSSSPLSKIDRGDPACSFSASPSTWTNEPVDVTATCSDSLSGCSNGSDTKTFDAEGEIKTFSFNDSAGNNVSCDYQVENIDLVAPTCGTDLSLVNTWTNGTIEASATCDPAPGDLEYQSPCATLPSSQTITKHNGFKSFTVNDEAGNESSCSTDPEQAWIDTKPPLISDLALEHIAFQIPSAPVVSEIDSESSPTSFRADDGEIRFYFTVEDAAADDENGQSGLFFEASNWEISVRRNTENPEIFSISELQQGSNIITGVDQDDQQNFEAEEYFIDLNLIGESDPIFSRTGQYKLQLTVFDKADNPQKSDPFYIDIYPGSASQTQSRLDGFNCFSSGLLANNNDICSGNLLAKDEFGNAIFDRDFEAYFAAQNTEGTYNLLASPEDLELSAQTAFENGLRFNGEDSEFKSLGGVQKHTDVFTTATGTLPSPGNGKTENIEISNLVPTIKIYESNSLTANGKAYLASETSRSNSIVFISSSINTDGSINDSENTTITYTPSFTFDRWIKNDINIDGDDNILLDEQKAINIWTETRNTQKPLPTNFTLALKGWAPEGTDFEEAYLGESGNISKDDLDGISKSFSGGGNSNLNTVWSTHLRGDGDNVLTNLQTAFTSQIYIPVLDLDESSTTRGVFYPGSNLGNTIGNQSGNTTVFSCNSSECSEELNNQVIEAFTIGANISGNILTTGKTAIQSDESTALDLGGVEVKDIRQETTANAYEIVRGMDPIDLEDGIQAVSFPAGKDVVYYKEGTVKIGPLTGESAFSGVKTIVIEDGNLLIAGDMEYAGATDSLGVILINSNIGEKPDTGNIFVNKDVKKFVGTYFADGSLTSTTKTGQGTSKPSINDSLDRDADRGGVLNKQLLLEGTLFTKNTLGGSYLDPMQNPWGEEDDIADAQKYDLHFVRRYSPLLFTDENEKLEHCVNVSETECDPEGSSFLIRPDNRVQFFPPPGFSSN